MYKYILAIMLAVGLFIVGCGGGSNLSSPITPGITSQSTQSISQSSNSLWGMWEVNIDPVTGEIESIPMRGSMFNANVQSFLFPPKAPINLMTFQLQPESDFAAGYVKVRVGIKHPFPGIAKFRGFDVRCIAMFDSDTIDIYDPAIMYGKPDINGLPTTVGYVMNPDGYTRWWNPVEFIDPLPLLSYKPTPLGTQSNPTATLNAYKYFADELDPDGDVAALTVEGRGSFSTSGAVNTRDFDIQFPTDPLAFKFNLAVDASWALPDPDFEPQGYPVEAFPPDAGAQEPFHITTVQTGGDLFYIDGASGGSLDLEVTVYDWQAYGTESGVMDEISSLWLSGAPLVVPLDIYSIATVIPGPNAVSSTFQIEIDSSMMDLTSHGTFEVLGIAESVDPDTYQPQLEGGENFIFPNGVLSAYFMAQITVNGELPEFQVLKPNGGEAWSIDSEQTITWTGGEGFDTVNIEYSKDDFVSDINEIVTGAPNTGSYVWEQVPNDTSETVKVRISSADFPDAYDDSDAYFSIIESLWERIVYAADGPADGRQIYSIDPEGLTEPEQWSASPVLFNESPKLSPCGQYILYCAADFGGSEIRLIEVATGIETNITPDGYAAVYGDFSHDGTKIVSAMTTDAWYMPKDLATCDYNGENVEVLTSGADAWGPEYSTDDSMIIYQAFDDSEVYIYEVVTGEITQYTTNGSKWDDTPHFSPDSTQVAWATSYPSTGGRHIWVSPITAWDPNDYEIDFATYIRSPCFSPDGLKISFDHGGFDGSELAIYTVADGTHVNITENEFGDYMTDWGYMIPH